MNPIVKRIVLLGGAVLVGGVLLFSSGVLPLQRGLPAADPAAAPRPTTTTAAPAAGGATGSAVAPKENERMQQLQQRLAENPRDAAALAEVVDTFMQAKRYAQAAEFLAQAFEAGIETPRLRVGSGLALFYQGMPTLAQRELKRALELDPNLAEAHYYYGLMMSHGPGADMQAARTAWETVVRIDGEGELGRRAKELLAGS